MVANLQEKSSEPDRNWITKEWLKCQQSPQFFFQKYAKIQDRAKRATIRFEPWKHLTDLLSLFLTEPLVIVLKARQLGISWLVCAYAVWMAKFHSNCKILMLSQGEEEAFDLISKCRFIDDQLPEFLKCPREPDQRGFIGYPDSGSEIKALPSTEKAGRSTDATVVICDEWEFHPYAEANFAALKPTIDGGGQFIGLSTADKTRIDTFFKAKYYEATKGDSNFKPIFLSWRLRPGRNDEWFANVTKDLRAWQVEQEYPDTEQEALGTLRSIPYFDIDILQQMLETVLIPTKDELSDKHKTVRIYKPPVVGQRYVMFTDPSDGKEDPHATVVEDYQTGEWVAVSHGKVTADYCAQIHDDLARYYKAFNSYELNARAGGIFSQKIKDLNTPNQCPFVKTDGTLNKDKTGWWTGGKLKDTMEQGLEEAIRLRKIRIYYPEAIKELMSYFRPEGQDPQAPRGGHDDFIIAGGGVRQIRKYMQSGEMRVTSFKYKD